MSGVVITIRLDQPRAFFTGEERVREPKYAPLHAKQSRAMPRRKEEAYWKYVTDEQRRQRS
jgi:hypothetical protein